MTAVPEVVPTSPIQTPVREVDPLEALFSIGYATSQPKIIYQDNNYKVEVVFRTLTPPELRDVYEVSSQYSSVIAQSIMERLETLARTVVTINNMPLILTVQERQKYFEENKKNPSPLEQAKIILNEKVKSSHLIDAIYSEYTAFADEIAASFEDIKKKLKNPTSSDSTST